MKTVYVQRLVINDTVEDRVLAMQERKVCYRSVDKILYFALLMV